MIDVLKEKHAIMKSPQSLERDAALIVLNEIRTIEMLERGEITSKMQYKWFEKLLSNRNTSANIYKTQNRMDLYEKENAEINVIKKYMADLETDMPKQMNEDDVKAILEKMKNDNPHCKIGDVMKFFSREYPEQNKAMVSKIFQSLN